MTTNRWSNMRPSEVLEIRGRLNGIVQRWFGKWMNRDTFSHVKSCVPCLTALFQPQRMCFSLHLQTSERKQSHTKSLLESFSSSKSSFFQPSVTFCSMSHLEGVFVFCSALQHQIHSVRFCKIPQGASLFKIFQSIQQPECVWKLQWQNPYFTLIS